jgi:hypothetical protein
MTIERLMDRDGVKRYTALYGPGGEIVVVDQFKKRYDHMRKRVFGFSDEVKYLEASGVPCYYKHMTLTYDYFGTKGDASEWQANDMRDFIVRLLRYLQKTFPAVRLYGYAWAGEIQPNSKHYHFELMMVTDKRLWLPNARVRSLWGHGFVYAQDGRSVYYLCSYLKKTSQKNFWYFPFHARAFAVVIKHDVTVEGQALYLRLRMAFLKDWQWKWLCDHSIDNVLNMATLKDAHPPKSDWLYVRSYTQHDADWFEGQGVTLSEAIEAMMSHGESSCELVGSQVRSVPDTECLVQSSMFGWQDCPDLTADQQA